jgi:hypothetical protein
MERTNSFIEKLGGYEVTVVYLSLIVASLISVFAVCSAPAEVKTDFFATIAQVLPVFLIAFAVEQRLLDRLGMSEDEYVRSAEQSLGLAVNAEMAFDDANPEKGDRLQKIFYGRRDFTWVGRYSHDSWRIPDPDLAPDIEDLARTRFRGRRRSEAVFVLATITLLSVGEGSALAGLLQDGVSRCSPILWLSIFCTVASFLTIVLGAVHEYARGLIDG